MTKQTHSRKDSVTSPKNGRVTVEASQLEDTMLPARSTLTDRITELRFTAPGKGEEIINFNTEYAKSLSHKNIQQLERILRVDPFFNGGKPGEIDGKVSVSNPKDALELINKYLSGGVFKDFENGKELKLAALAPEAVKAFTAMVSWYIAYRSSFPDPTETESLSNILKLIKDTKNGEASWDICVLPTPEGKVAAAFSGQALDVKLKNGETVRSAWGEHIFVVPELRNQGHGAKILSGFADKLGKQFGPRDMVVIEVDNAFGIIDPANPKYAVYFDHQNPAARQAAWTDPNGENMAMDPFRRMKVWDRLGFMLMAVHRKDVAGPIAAPYTQIPLDKGGEPCETIILAVRPSDEMRAKFDSGEIGAAEMNRVYRAMMKTVSGTYNQDPSYKAVQEELRRLKSPKISLVRFYGADGELNPEAIKILRTTAAKKLRAE